MEAINHDLHALAKHLFGCMHKPCIHICTYGVDRLTYALRDTTEKCFDCGFLTVRQHPQNDCLCLHTSCDDGHKITVTFFQRYLFFIGFGKGTPWSIPRECLGGGRVPITMEALIAFRAKMNKSFPAQNGQMS